MQGEGLSKNILEEAPSVFRCRLILLHPISPATALSLPISYSIFSLCSSEGLLFKLSGEREGSGAKLVDNKRRGPLAIYSLYKE